MIKKTAWIIIAIIFIAFIKPSAVLATASLSLSPATASKNLNNTFNVDVVLDTGGDSASGVSVILTYDTTRLTALTVTAGTALSQNPLLNTIDTTTGRISYDSGNLSTPFTGRGTVAIVQFKAIAAGTASVNFVFNPGATSGTSLVASSLGPTNLLGTVNGGNYTIGGTATQPPPASGTLEDTLILLGGGLSLLTFGFFVNRWNANRLSF